MRTSLFIARRYFFSKKQRNFINIISNMSMVGVAIGTMALVIVLSVFNGLEHLIRSLYSTFDPQIKVSSMMGKSFPVDEKFLYKIKSIDGVSIITEVIEDNVLLKYKEDQMVVKMKGVSDNFIQQNRMDSMIVAGKFALRRNNADYAVIGRGIQYILSISLGNEMFPLQLWYPKSNVSVNLNPEKVFNRESIMTGSVFAIEKQYDDNYIFVPLKFAQRLLDYTNKRTALEVKVKKGYKINKVRDKIKEVLGKKYKILNSDEQHASLLRAVKIEKFFVYITFSFILAIASFNIFFSLTMLAIDKKKDVAILYAMGAGPNFVKKLFLLEGCIIAFVGAGLGLLSGLIICVLQQRYGLVSMGMETSIVDAYPVRIEALDFLSTGLTIMVITIAASYRPAIRASKIIIRENLK